MDSKELYTYKNRLLNAGIPWRKATRNVQEVQDHFQDLKQQALDSGCDMKAAEQSAREQLGTLDKLAQAVIADTRKSLLYRHPAAMTLVLPLATYTGICALMMISMLLVVQVLTAMYGDVNVPPVWLGPYFDLSILIQFWLLTPLLVFVLIQSAIRQRVLLRYWLPGVLLLCVLGSAATMWARVPDPASGEEGMLGLSFLFNHFLLNEQVPFIASKLFVLLRNLLLSGAIAWYLRAREKHLLFANA